MNLPSSLVVSVLTISGFMFPAVQTATSDDTPAPPDLRSDGARVVQIAEPTVVVATEHEVLILQFSEKIQSVIDVDEAAVDVDAVARQPAQLRVRPLSPVRTSLRFVLDSGTVVPLTLVFSKGSQLPLTPRKKTMMSVMGVSGREKRIPVEEGNLDDLKAVIDHIDPLNTVDLLQVSGGVMMKGTIYSAGQLEQVTSVAECFFPRVVNQLVVMRHKWPWIEAAMAKREKADAEVAVADETDELPGLQGVSELRADIRSLHEDVREMIHLLEQMPAGAQPAESDAGTDAACSPGQLMDLQMEASRKEDPVIWAGIMPVDSEDRQALGRRFRVDKIPTFAAVVEREVVRQSPRLLSEQELKRLMGVTSSKPE